MKKSISLLLVLAVLLSCIGCAQKEESKTVSSGGTGNLPVLKVAVIPYLNSVPVKYIVDNGLDVANGFKIETVFFTNGALMNEALASNQWEVGTLSAASVNSLAIYGAYCVSEIGHSEGGIYTLTSKDSEIAKVKGANPSYPNVYGDAETLKGKSIGVLTGAITHLNVIKWLEGLGLTEQDVQIVGMDLPTAYQALVTDRIDIAALNAPTSYQAESEGYLVASSLANLSVPQYDSIIVSNKAFKERADMVTNYIKAFYQATDALQANPDMAAQVLLDWYTENGTTSNIEACKKEVIDRPFVTSEEAKGIKVGESVQITGEFNVSQGLLQEDKFPEIAKHIDDTLVKKALGIN